MGFLASTRRKLANWISPDQRKSKHAHGRIGIGGAGGFEAGQDKRTTKRLWSDANFYGVNWSIAWYLGTVRARARYEMQNNGLLDGISNTWTTDVVGKGPILQIHVDDDRYRDAQDFQDGLEWYFGEWRKIADITGMGTFDDALRLGERNQFQDGEDLWQDVMTDSDEHELRTRIAVLETDLLATPWNRLGDPRVTMGIETDSWGRPTFYHIMKEFPTCGVGPLLAGHGPFNRVPAAEVTHDFRYVRTRQMRGMPWVTPILDISAVYRDYIESVLTSNQVASKFSAVAYTEHPDADFDDLDDELPVWDLETGAAVTLPRGWKIGQVKPEHPGTSFVEFTNEIKRIMGRPVSMPLIRVHADATGSTYTAGRMDTLSYWRQVEVRQSILEHKKCNPQVKRVALEASLLRLIPRPPTRWWAEWRWPAAPVIDEQKAARAQADRKTNGTTSLAHEVDDWEDMLQTQARVEKRRREIWKENGLEANTEQQSGEASSASEPKMSELESLIEEAA